MTPQELLGLLQPGHDQTLVHRLAGLSEAERKKLAPAVRKVSPWSFTGRYDDLALGIAVLGTLGGVRQVARHLPTHGTHPDLFPVLAVQVLRDRQPAWLASLPDALLVEGATHWRLVRALVREGLVERPDEAEYFVQLGWGVLPEHGRDADGVLGALRADSALLEHDLWSMLETEGAGRRLQQTDGWMAELRSYDGNQQRSTPTPGRTWMHALVTLSATGELDRGRLLDAALAAPLRDWAAADVTWFLRLHDALEPTQEEVVERQARYTRLLTSQHGTAVKLAQKRITPLLGDDRFDVPALLAASPAVLSRSDKATVTGQLGLLAALHKKRPGVAAAAAEAVTVALEHPRADVRECAGVLLGKLGQEPAPEAAPTPGFAPLPPEPLPAPAPVEPVRDADELAELLLRLVEEADDPIDVERAFEGALRLVDRRPEHADALLRRVEETELFVHDLRRDVAEVARAWLTKPGLRGRLAPLLQQVAYTRAPHAGSLAWFHELRMVELRRALRRASGTSVALPTHADGSIEAAALHDRLSRLGRPRATIGGTDLGLALLRVDPASLGEAIPKKFLREWVPGCVELLQTWAPTWQRVNGQSQGIWSFHDRTQAALTFATRDVQAPGSGPVGQLADRRGALGAAGWDADVGHYEPRFEQLVAAWATYLPHLPDLFASHLHPVLHRDLARDRGAGTTTMDALARSATPTGPVEASALVLGLAAKDVRVRTAAQDAVIDRARHGLLDGEEAGRQLAAHLADGTVVGQRVVAGLQAVAEAEDRTALPVLATLETVLPATKGRRDASAWVSLAADLVQRTGHRLVVPPHLSELAAGRSASLVARAARRL